MESKAMFVGKWNFLWFIFINTSLPSAAFTGSLVIYENKLLIELFFYILSHFITRVTLNKNTVFRRPIKRLPVLQALSDLLYIAKG